MGEEGWALLSEPPAKSAQRWGGVKSPPPPLPLCCLGCSPHFLEKVFYPSYLYPPAVLVQHRQVERTSELGVPAGTCAAGGGVGGIPSVSNNFNLQQVQNICFFFFNECLN